MIYIHLNGKEVAFVEELTPQILKDIGPLTKEDILSITSDVPCIKDLLIPDPDPDPDISTFYDLKAALGKFYGVKFIK